MPKKPKADEETDTVLDKPAVASSEFVDVVVTKHGEGKVSTGEHIAGQGDVYAPKGHKLKVLLHTAKALEAKGFAEIL